MASSLTIHPLTKERTRLRLTKKDLAARAQLSTRTIWQIERSREYQVFPKTANSLVTAINEVRTSYGLAAYSQDTAYKKLGLTIRNFPGRPR